MSQSDIIPCPASLDEAIAALLARATELFCPLPDPQAWSEKYGATFRFEAAGTLVQMQRYCWCESGQCPWCSASLCEEEFSPEDILRLRPVFEDNGWVEGEAAPNFRLATPGFSIAVWWYKYIGRSMKIACTETLSHAAISKAMARIEEIALTHRRGILSESLSQRLADTDPGLAAALRPILAARLAAATDTEIDGAAAEIATLLPELVRVGWVTSQIAEVTSALDAAGIPSCDPEMAGMPADLCPAYAPAYRVAMAMAARCCRSDTPHDG